jgi:CubicO group peptidase (beta-lactamase class C family)
MISKYTFISTLIFFCSLLNAQEISAKDQWQWQKAKLADVGMKKNTITKAHWMLKNNKFPKVDSMLIVRHGKLAYERYYNQGSKKRLHKLESAGKSFLSAIFGIVYDKGLFKSLDDKVYGYYKKFFKDIKNWDQRKAKMTIHHLMTMRSGWDCDINYANKRCSKQMLPGKSNIESIKWVLDRPMAFEPGSKMQYTDVNPIMLDTLIYLVSGKTTAEIARTNLYGPMGISKKNFGAFTSRQMAMLGHLYLNKGKWNGEQIISENWIEKSTKNIYPLKRIKPGIVQGYGYFWWVGKFKSKTSDLIVDGFFAAGNGGQYIIILPSVDMVVVFTGHDYDTPGMTKTIKIVEDYILPAILEK